MADDRASVYLEDLPFVPGEGRGQRWVIRASALGRCVGELVRTGMGLTPAPHGEGMLRAFSEGVEYEPIIIEKLASDEGWRMLGDGELQQAWGEVDDTGQLLVEVGCGVSGDGVPIVVRCHPDGVVRRYKAPVDDEHEVGETRVLEVKFLADGFRWEDLDAYSWQHSVEMIGTKLPGLYVVARKLRGEDGELLGMRDGLELTYFDKPKFNKGQIKARAQQIIEAIEQRKVPACDQKMFPCGFWQEHDKTEGVWAEKQVEVLEIDGELETLIGTWKAAKREADGAAADLKLARQQVLEAIDGSQVGEVEAGWHRVLGETGVEINRRAGRKQFNKTDAIKDGVDVEKYMKQGADYWEIGEMR